MNFKNYLRNLGKAVAGQALADIAKNPQQNVKKTVQDAVLNTLGNISTQVEKEIAFNTLFAFAKKLPKEIEYISISISPIKSDNTKKTILIFINDENRKFKDWK